MRNICLNKIWKIFLSFIFIFILIHFLKDLTQDILKISTPLDWLGDAKEDLSFLPKPVQTVYLYGLGGFSILAEVFLLIVIPKVWRRKEFSKLNQWILVMVIFLITFFITATLLDPRFNPWFKIREPVLTPITKVEKRKIIISTDNAATKRLFDVFAIEPDDALALAVLLDAHKRSEIEILGIVSTFGNTDGISTYQITKKQIELSGLNIPVVKGAEYPEQLNSETVEFIASLIKNNDKITFLALGPVTDYAAVFTRYPELKNKVAEFMLIRSGPYLNKERWFLFSFNAQSDVRSAICMYELGANQYSMGEEIFSVGLNDATIKKIQQVNHPMIQFISTDLKRWNLQNKAFPIKGYFSRGGDMLPWDLVWAMYLVEPELYDLVVINDHTELHIKNKTELIDEVFKRISGWEELQKLESL